MLSIVEREGPQRLEELVSKRDLPDMLSMPDVATLLARELVRLGPPLPTDREEARTVFMELVRAFMNVLTDAVTKRKLACGAKFYHAAPSDPHEQYSFSIVLWPWLEWRELVSDYLTKVKDYVDGKLVEKPTPDQEAGLVDVRIMRNDLRSWFECERWPLPAFWFASDEIEEHARNISKPAAGANAANARFDVAREFAEQVYRNSLAEDHDAKPGSVAKTIHGVIADNLEQFGLTSAPTIETIKDWIKPLAPASARRPGRPRK